MKVEICRGHKQCDLQEKKVLKVVLLGCGVCPHGTRLVSCDVFLVGGSCACVLIDGAGSHLSEG